MLVRVHLEGASCPSHSASQVSSAPTSRSTPVSYICAHAQAPGRAPPSQAFVRLVCSWETRSDDLLLRARTHRNGELVMKLTDRQSLQTNTLSLIHISEPTRRT